MIKERKSKNLIVSVILAIVMCFLSIITMPTRLDYAYASSVFSHRNSYSDSEVNVNNLTGFYRDTDDETSGYWGGNSNTIMHNDDFEITSGASLYKNSLDYLTFRICVKNNALLTDNQRLETYFDLFKVNDGGASSTNLIDLYQITTFRTSALYKYSSVGINTLVNTGTAEKVQIRLYGYEKNLPEDYNYSFHGWYNNVKENWEDGEIISFYDNTDRENNSWPKGCFVTDSNGYSYITIKVADYNTKYYLTMKYDINESDTDMPILSTQAVSVRDILKTMYRNSNDNVDVAFSELDYSLKEKCIELSTNAEMKNITISYLEQIGKTPFATLKNVTVDAPILSGNILTRDNAAKVLDLETIEFMQSYCKGFEYDYVTDSYKAIYLEGVCLRSKDADGHEVDYFLSPNKSYREYYYSFVENGVFDEDCYNYFWNSMIREFEEIWNVSDADLYGYFGYTVIPNKYTLNGLWDDIFDSRSFSGSISYFLYTDTLTQQQYDTLLGEKYSYSWLSRAWNGSMSLFDSYEGAPVRNYLFYVNDDGSDKLWIGENGADDFYDDSGAIKNDIEDIDFNEMFDTVKILILLVAGAIILFIIFKFVLPLITPILKWLFSLVILPFNLIFKKKKRKRR